MKNKVPAHVKEGLKYLGKDYTKKEIDLEMCIYRRISSSYDIEITYSGGGMCGTGYKAYLWDISRGEGYMAKIVDRMPRYEGLPELKAWLDDAVERYTLKSKGGA